MSIDGSRSSEKPKTSFFKNINNYADQQQKNKNLSPNEYSAVNASLNDPNVKSLLRLSAKVLATEKVMQLGQSSILGTSMASGGSFIPTLIAAEISKSIAIAGIIAADKKYIGTKTLMYGLSAIPGVCGFAPIIELYKNHRPLFHLVVSYMFNKQNDYKKKTSAIITLPTSSRNSIILNTSSKIKEVLLPSSSKNSTSSSSNNVSSNIISLPSTTRNSVNSITKADDYYLLQNTG